MSTQQSTQQQLQELAERVALELRAAGAGPNEVAMGLGRLHSARQAGRHWADVGRNIVVTIPRVSRWWVHPDQNPENLR